MPPLRALLFAAFAILTLTGCEALFDPAASRREARWLQEIPPLGDLIEVEGRQVHVLVTGRPRGSARDVVLIHGSNGNLRDFTFDLVDRLSPRYRVIAVDRPGLGYSDTWGAIDSDPREQARILQLALAQIGVTRPIVVGHSYGGAVAMGWALNAPSETGALVLISGATHPWDEDLSAWYRFNRTALAPTVRAALAAFAPEPAAHRAIADLFAPDPLPEGYVAHFGAGLSMRRSSQANNVRQVNDLLGYITAMAPQYDRLTLPIEILQGARDPVIAQETHGDRLIAQASGARLTVIEDAGHMLHHTHPEAVIAAIHRAASRAR
ncbi:alpha/beta fold hydrolase [Pararhodobacter oceanensis]|uniref:alpha/beta fold hydrolase n=1 Tax=Pararhodobacter oceanensis TaxID=2172121 RepID=UPI003A8DAB7D